MHANEYLWEVGRIAEAIDDQQIEAMAAALSKLEGSLYVVGLGGSLANAMHMAADLRNLCNIDAQTPNLFEMSARINDDGADSAFRTNAGGCVALFVLSVGGGTDRVSTGITRLVKQAHEDGIPIFGIVGPKGGVTAELGTYVIKIPATTHITPHTEAFQAVVWHCLVSHPLLQKRATKW